MSSNESVPRAVPPAEPGVGSAGAGAARRLAELEARNDELEKIREHRDWLIGTLREHIANLEELIARGDDRIARLEAHTENLETSRARAEDRARDLERHSANLERELAAQRARLADVEAHAANLERGRGRRRVRLAADGILPVVPQPRLDAIFRLAERMRRERPDLLRRYPDDRAADFWYWFLWHGPRLSDEVAERLYPPPDRSLMSRVVGHSTSPEHYHKSGLVDWWRIDGCLRQGGFDPAAGGSLLDFGVGCGRILQFFGLYASRCELVGADVDPEAVAWCAANLDFAHFEALPVRPPGPFADARFDAVYAFSVFSHLPEELHLRWLDELARVTRPGGVLVATVQGRRVIDEILDGQQPEAFPAAEALRPRLGELDRAGFAFFPYGRMHFGDPRNDAFFRAWDMSQYGSSFILEPYVRARWTQHFDLVALDEAPDDWQDYVVMRRKASD